MARSGNVSARSPRGFFITPTAASYDALCPTDLVELSTQYAQVLTHGEPVLLGPEQMAEVLRRFESYR